MRVCACSRVSVCEYRAFESGPSSGVYSLTLGEGPGLPGGPGRDPRERRGKVRLEKLEKPAKKTPRNNGKRNL